MNDYSSSISVIREISDNVTMSEKPRMSHRNRSDMCYHVRPRLGHWHRLMIFM
ncbi:hypothetical protein F383_32221 [Gossypium arboreum]|uniref:Uncharacterized protein n=2 Tax=Gossypium arboreum TaxID=29729 RepID=A0A0B0MDE0_GOSAR|nr:hypothetical protein F383_36851 [Gossypium arboreum]KHG06431.1 hypothetical protein F383_32221 [Gossypium arboreum]